MAFPTQSTLQGKELCQSLISAGRGSFYPLPALLSHLRGENSQVGPGLPGSGLGTLHPGKEDGQGKSYTPGKHL